MLIVIILSPSIAFRFTINDYFFHLYYVYQLCIGTVTGMLYSQKVSHPRRYVPNSEFSGYKDLQYDPDEVPDTEEKWAKTNFVEKTHWGCTGFPE